MADSLRLRVLKALTAQIETVTIANGYQHDLAGSVFRGRDCYGEETDKPAIAIFELKPDEYPVRADETVQKDEWFIGVQGVIDADPIHPTDTAHNLMADVKMAIAQALRAGNGMTDPPEYRLGGLVVDMKLDGGVVFAPGEDKSLTTFVVKVTLTIAEDLENPYE